MKRSVFLSTIIFLVGGILSAQQKTAKIMEGTVINLVVVGELSSETATVNAQVIIKSTEDVKVGDDVVIRKDALGKGKVLSAEKKGPWGKTGGLEISLDFIQAVDGSNVALSGKAGQAGGGKSTKAVALGIGGMFMKGKKVALGEGTVVSAYVAHDKTVIVGQ